MKVKLASRCVLFAALTSSCYGSLYVSNFAGWGSLSLVPEPATIGADSWTQSLPNESPTDPANRYPNAWITTVGNNGDVGAAIGAYYSSIYPTEGFYVNREISTTSLVGSDLTLRFALMDSVDWQYRNDFSVGLLDGAGGDLVTLDFTANSQTFPGTQEQRSWNVWIRGAATAFCAVFDDTTYDLTLNQFTVSGADASFKVYITDHQAEPVTFDSSGTVAGGATKNVGNLRVGTTLGLGADWGDNQFAFVGIPEPGVTMLLGLGALGLLRRRRNA